MKEFQCVRCGVCCRWEGYVYITEDDIKRMAKHLSLSEFEFVNTYAEMVNRPRLTLKMKTNNEYIFLKDNDCAMHEARPCQCESFPSTWKVKDLERFCNGQKRVQPEDTKRP